VQMHVADCCHGDEDQKPLPPTKVPRWVETCREVPELGRKETEGARRCHVAHSAHSRISCDASMTPSCCWSSE
jgi:hypothetical protein